MKSGVRILAASLLCTLSLPASVADGGALADVLGRFKTKGLETARSDVLFLFWSRAKPVEPVALKSHQIPTDLYLGLNPDPQSQIRILIHGFNDHGRTQWIQDTRDRYLELENCLVISLDWKPMAGSGFVDYTLAAYNTKPVGLVGAQLVMQLANHLRVPLERFHVIGFSLGAQVAGYLGQALQGRLGRVTGLDPAAPFFSFSRDRISRDSAQFVDIIHGAGEPTSIESRMGHADFYPNGGTHPQPGCFWDKSIDHKCSHFIAPKLFQESISNPNAFCSRRCWTWEDYKRGLCNGNTLAQMGEHVDRSLKGPFYLYTRGQAPFTMAEVEETIKPSLKNVGDSDNGGGQPLSKRQAEAMAERKRLNGKKRGWLSWVVGAVKSLMWFSKK